MSFTGPASKALPGIDRAGMQALTAAQAKDFALGSKDAHTEGTQTVGSATAEREAGDRTGTEEPPTRRRFFKLHECEVSTATNASWAVMVKAKSTTDVKESKA